jgi:2-polyprenyl-6-methoxyphenol hydroxylase-like FAD-dependent oxidoreductase
MNGQSVLISGGSIAGPAIAWWLNRYGFKTTLVERWPELRPGGQGIDVNDQGVSCLCSSPTHADGSEGYRPNDGY